MYVKPSSDTSTLFAKSGFGSPFLSTRRRLLDEFPIAKAEYWSVCFEISSDKISVGVYQLISSLLAADLLSPPHAANRATEAKLTAPKPTRFQVDFLSMNFFLLP